MTSNKEKFYLIDIVEYRKDVKRIIQISDFITQTNWKVTNIDIANQLAINYGGMIYDNNYVADINGSVRIVKNCDIYGNLSVMGSTYLSNLTVEGDINNYGKISLSTADLKFMNVSDVHVSMNISVDGNIYTNTLNVQNNTNLSSLNVQNNTSTDTLYVQNNSNISSLNVRNNTTLGSLNVQNNTSMSSLKVNDLTNTNLLYANETTTKNLSVIDNTNMSALVVINKTTTNSLSVYNETNTNSLNVTNDISANRLYITNDISANSLNINQLTNTKDLTVTNKTTTNKLTVENGAKVTNGLESDLLSVTSYMNTNNQDGVYISNGLSVQNIQKLGPNNNYSAYFYGKVYIEDLVATKSNQADTNQQPTNNGLGSSSVYNDASLYDSYHYFLLGFKGTSYPITDLSIVVPIIFNSYAHGTFVYGLDNDLYGTPASTFDLSANAGFTGITYNGPIHIGQSSPNVFDLNATSIHLSGDVILDNDLIIGGNITSTSDKRLKENITPLTDCLNKINKLSGYSYTRNDLPDKNKKYLGLIAQEVEDVFPELVTETNNMKSVNYQAFTAVLLECVKELSSIIQNKIL